MANPWDNDPVVGGKTATPAEFAKVYGGAAKSAGKALGIDPNVIIGQWGLETGWGKSIIPGTNNLGNIKDFSGSGVGATDNMTGSKDKYRSYATADDFAKDYVSLIQRKYPGAQNAGSDPAKFTAGLKGYAEDPRYADKVAQASRMAGTASNPVLRGLNAVAGAVLPSANAAQGNPWDNDPVVGQTAPAAPAAKPASRQESRTTNADYQAGRGMKNSGGQGVGRFLLSTLNGPTMGFGDEIAGAVGGAIDSIKPGGKLSDIRNNYVANRDFARGAQDAEKEDYPWQTAGFQTVASLPLGAAGKLLGAAPTAAGAIAKPVNMLGQVLNAGKVGAAYGAASGAGNSTSETVGGLATDTAIGGASGAALSAVALPVSRVLGAVGSNVAQRVSAKSAGRAAEEKVAEALVRDARGAVVQSGASNPVKQATNRLAKLGDEAVLADAGGQNTKSLLDLLATLPGKTKDAANTLIHDRQSGRAGRLIGAADKALGTNGQRLAGTVDDLVTARSTAAAPIYQQLHQQSVAPSPALQSIVQAADELGAVTLGRKMSTAAQQPFTLNSAPAPRNGLTNQNGQQWSMRDLDHVKQGLDQLISKQWDAVNGKLTPLGGKYELLKNNLVKEMDTATMDPQTGASLYKSARDAFSGPSAMIDAARAGQMSISKNEAAIAQIAGKLSESERKAFQVGAFEALREKVGRSEGGRTEIIDMWKNPAIQDKLKALFGNERSFREFAATAAKEGRLKGLESVGRGSQTAARQYAAGDLDVPALADAGTAVASAATGNIPGALRGIANTWNRVKTPEATRNAMGQILMSGGAEGKNRLAAMADLTARINAQHAKENGLIGVLAAKPAGSWFLD